MRHVRTTAASLALVVGVSGCFFPVYEGHRHHLEEEHRDRHIVILETKPAPEGHCWRHDGHWHCRRDAD